MLSNAYLLAKIGADTAENEQHFAENLPIGRRVADRCTAIVIEVVRLFRRQLDRRGLVLAVALGLSYFFGIYVANRLPKCLK